MVTIVTMVPEVKNLSSLTQHRCHVLTLVPFLCLYFGLVRAWVGVGILCFVLCFVLLCGWPGMVPNQRQLAIVVSDWEPYWGSMFPPVFVGSCFLSLCLHQTELVRVGLFFVIFVLVVWVKININMDSYHAAFWSDLDNSSSDEEDRYNIPSFLILTGGKRLCVRACACVCAPLAKKSIMHLLMFILQSRNTKHMAVILEILGISEMNCKSVCEQKVSWESVLLA
jgi:hypothetical protein